MHECIRGFKHHMKSLVQNVCSTFPLKNSQDSIYLSSYLFLHSRKWYEDGVTLLILITIFVVLPLALLPKIGECSVVFRCVLFSVCLSGIFVSIGVFFLLRFSGIH